MKYGVIGDLHWNVKGGDVDFLNFQVKWWKKSLKKMHEMGIKHILQTGDILDVRKQIDVRVGNVITREILPELDKYDMMMTLITGNHDIFLRDSNSIRNTWFFEDNPRIHIIPEFHEEDNILFLSWINKNNVEYQMKAVERSNAKYLIGHLELVNFPMSPGVVASHGQDASLYKKFDKVLSGHYHGKCSIGNIDYVGAPYALTWGDYSDMDNKGWHVFDTDTGSLELIKNDEDDTLFAVHEYDPEHKYVPEDLQKYNGKIVRYVVKDKGQTRAYTKFLEAVRQVKAIDYQIIDETIVIKTEKNATDFDPSKMLTNMSQIVVDYSAKLAESTAGADVDITKSITADLYQRSQ